MEYKVENTVRLNTKSPHSSLYKWFLEEFDPAGKRIGAHYIPWGWSLHFDVRNLAVRKSLDLSDDKPGQVSEMIVGTLIPERGGRRGTVSYSFFGTTRKVGSFTLRIYKSEDDTEARQVWGSISYEAEFEFRNELTPDAVEVILQLPATKFDHLAKFIEDGRSKAWVTLKMVHGFYADWSPSIITDHIKILGNLTDQRVQIEDGADVTPPTLGKLGDFAMYFQKGGKAPAEEDQAPTGDAPSSALAVEEPPETMNPKELAAALAKVEAKLAKLSTPLWIAAVALIVSLLTR
ncbi:hypothetical protein [Sinorhizobium meliloti]|uniref:hypothetical protein n=1 Tax=Rhizobium meliloti TaxID=382 RepID=UPI0030AD90F9